MSCEIKRHRLAKMGIATQERIDTFVVKGSAQLTVPADRQGKIQVRRRGVAPVLFSFKLNNAQAQQDTSNLDNSQSVD